MEQIAVLRAEWLTQLEDAIEGAQRLAWQLGSNQATSNEARNLYGRLEEAKLQLDSLRGLGRTEAPPIERDWLLKFGWRQPEDDRD